MSAASPLKFVQAMAEDAAERERVVARDTIQALQDRIDMLEEALGLRTPMPTQWRLTPTEERLLGMLYTREFCSRDMIMTGLYSARAGEEPSHYIVGVYIHKLRRKLADRGIQIGNCWGRGWFMDATSKAIIRNAIERRDAA